MTIHRKKIIPVKLDNMSGYEFDGPLVSVRDNLNRLIEKYGEGVYFEYEREHYEPYDEHPTPLFHIKTNREETDVEFAERLKKEAKDNKDRETRERLEYERLNKKFGKK